MVFHDPKFGIRCVSVPSGDFEWNFRDPGLDGRKRCPIAWVDEDSESVVVVGGAKGKVRLWDARTGTFIQTLTAQSIGKIDSIFLIEPLCSNHSF